MPQVSAYSFVKAMIISTYILEAAIKARAMPVFPLVASTRTH
jgi:hypothetical protein